MHTYRVTANERLTPSTIRVTLEPDGKSRHPFAFEPGQYAAISFERHGRPSVARCFSIVSSPTDNGQLQFSMRARGRFTTALSKANVGDTVFVRGPYGGFVFEPERHSDTLFIAGGIGITPFMSMLRYATAIRSSRHISLIYGVQSQDDLPFHTELDALASQNPNIDVTYAVSNGPFDRITVGHVAEGRVTPELLKTKLASARTFFICGPPPFMNGMVKALSEQGVPHDRIITEAFNQGSLRQTGKVASWPQNMYALGAFGIGLGALAIMVSDIVKTLPNVPLSDESALSTPLTSSGQREQDLDALVNALQDDVNRPSSPSAVAASLSTSPTGSTSTAQQATTPAPIVSAPAPVAVQPKCTTSQSGITTCY